MKSIAVVCASQPHVNPGMALVDRAWGVVEQHGSLNAESSRYRLSSIAAPQREGEVYLDLETSLEQVREADCILYWGDFLHMDSYLNGLSSSLVQAGRFSSAREARSFVERAFLLADTDNSTKGRVVAFGGTILLDAPKSRANGTYGRNLESLIGNSRAWLPRDVYSAVVAGRIRGKSEVDLGIDCALLGALTEGGASHLTAVSPSGERPVGVFFGRTRRNPIRLFQFVRALTERTESRTLWVPWFPWSLRGSRKKYYSLRGLAQIYLESEARISGEACDREGELLATLRQCRYVITDTYHLSVVCWGLGVPAICIADIASSRSYDFNSGQIHAWRDKRYLHYMMNDQLDFFVHWNELQSKSRLRSRVEHVMRALEDDRLLEHINWQMAADIERAEARLIDELRALIE